MNKKRLARAALIFAVAALVALTAGCLAACDRDDGKVTVNATINMTYGDAIPEWTVTLDGADEGDTAESLGIADAIVIADESLTELPDAGTHTFDIDISGVRQSKYELVAGKATLNVSKRPVKVHVTDQEVPYSSTGAKPYTDGTQANVEGTLVQGHTLSLGITAETDEVLDAGKTSSMAFDGSAKVFAGGTDVTSNYAIEVSADENLVMTVVKGVAKYIAYAAVDYDGNNHTFNGSNATLWVESGQDVTVSNGDVAFKEGGEHAAADIFIKGTSNWEEQRVKGVLGIRSFENEDGGKMTLTEACDAAAEAEDGLTVYMFTDTVIGIDTVIPDGLTVVTRVIGANKNDGEDEDHDLSDIVGEPTYSEKANKGAANKHVDADATKVEHVLTVKDGVTLNIEGALIVSGLLGNMGQGLSGHTSGEHCVLALEGDAVVSEGGALDIRGYVRGEGTLTAKSGSATYMPFVVYDFRGGSYTTVVYMKGDISPFNTFDPFYNIQASAVFESGATATSYLDLYTSTGHNLSQADMIGTEDSFFMLSDGAKIMIDWTESQEYSGTTGRNSVTMLGNIALGDLTVNVGGMVGINAEISLSDVTLAMSQRFDWRVGDGKTETTVSMPHSYKLLPGAELRVAEKATLTIENSMIVYTTFTDFGHAGIKYPAGLDPALFEVNGTVKFAYGAAFGGRITASADGARVITGGGFKATTTSVEGSSGNSASAYGSWNILLGKGDFVKTFEITETARFNEGTLTETVKEGEKFWHNDTTSYTYTLRTVECTSEAPLKASTTYTYDAESGNWK